MSKKIPIEVSARHLHLCRKDLEALFGKGYQLKKLRDLDQIEEYVAEETVDVQVNSRKIPNVRIVLPVRKETQIELSHTDAIFLRVAPIVRKSGYLKGTPGCVLVSSKNKIEKKKGIINNWRHIHCNPKEAEELGFENGMLVSVKTEGICSVTFHNVRVQVKPNYRLCMHLDTDEGNATCITKKGEGILLNIVL